MQLTEEQADWLNLLGWITLYYSFNFGWRPFIDRWFTKKEKP